MREFRHRLRLFAWAVASIPLAAFTLVLFVLAITGTALVSVWIGIPILDRTIPLTRALANFHRRYAGGLVGRTIDPPYLRDRDGGWVNRLRGWVLDPASRRDLLWLVLNGTLGLALSCVAAAETILDLIFWWLPSSVALRAHARLCAALLEPSEKSRLALRVQQLSVSRAETIDTQAAELRRIERDLHDGAQARLVSLGMSLAMAEEMLDQDPQLARTLLTEARESTSTALTELRSLVRGIHPPVLADRGFVEGVRALAVALPMPVEVQTNVTQRLSAAVESAAYFAIAEALANVVKHASARHVTIRVMRSEDVLEMLVEDDGIGGAAASRGTGVDGVARRLAAFDGVLTLDSPVGGPTKVAMVLPCASSSLKTLPSSGTA